MATGNDKVIRKLNDLIELDHDAIEAYRAAIERLEDPVSREQLSLFCGDHERHTRNLTALVTKLGGEPSRGPDMARFLTKGKVVIGGLVGGDRTVMAAMLANEEVTNKRYEIALSADGMDSETRQTLQSNLDDEHRHRAWIKAKLEAETESKQSS
jgi:uncharacterized protein (TIGR02284 family)